MTKKEAHEHQKPEASHALEDRLVHNLIELQKVHANLAEKFDKLSSQMSQLLALFEVSARSFARQTNFQGAEKDREFLDKIDRLLDQNKTIAKGLTLMEEKMRERLYGQAGAVQGQQAQQLHQFDTPRPLPRF